MTRKKRTPATGGAAGALENVSLGNEDFQLSPPATENQAQKRGGCDIVVEAKARANGFSSLYAWLEDRDLLIIKADRLVLPLRLAAAERGMP